MFFGSDKKLKEEIELQDEQISTLQLAIEELNEERTRKLKDKDKKYKVLDKKLDLKIEELEDVNKKLDRKIRELKEAIDNLERVTNSDTLTGAYNKRYFYDVAENMISLAKREKHSLTLAMINIDNFEKINESYGYAVGDEILQTVVHKIAYTLRESDIFVRFGEKEFVILFPSTNVEHALIASQKIRKVIETCTVIHNIDLTVSIGIAEFVLDEDNIVTALKKAETALSKAEKNSVSQLAS